MWGRSACAGLLVVAACSSGAEPVDMGWVSGPGLQQEDDDVGDASTAEGDPLGDESSDEGDASGGAPDDGVDPDGGSDMPIVATAATAPCHEIGSDVSAAMAVDGDPSTKFRARGSSVWVQLDVGGLAVLTRYAIISADDAPERDPARWILLGSNDTTAWTEIDVRVDFAFEGRGERRELDISGAAPYRFYLLRVENRMGDEVQIGEIELFGRSGLPASGLAAPAAAKDLTAVAASRTQVDLAWRGDADVFRIERSVDGQTFESIGYATDGATRFSVRALAPSSTAYYRVVAENAAGSAEPSTAASATTLPVFGLAAVDGWRYADVGYTLTVDYIGIPAVPPSAYDRFIDEFFVTYPAMAAAYNPGAPRDVRLTFDPTYDGVAAAGGTHIKVSASWFADHHADTDVIVHEGFHLVQAYSGDVPGWATEGLADYVRWSTGNYNHASCWTLQRYTPGQHYTDGYGVTARFFLWLATEYGPGIPEHLDEALRTGTYDDGFWIAETGESIDALWEAYANDRTHPPVAYE